MDINPDDAKACGDALIDLYEWAKKELQKGHSDSFIAEVYRKTAKVVFSAERIRR